MDRLDIDAGCRREDCMSTKRWLALGVVLGGLGCARGAPQVRGPCEEPPPFTLQIHASERLNPDDRGRALPTLIQVLQLEESRRLEAADFQQVWQQPKEVLDGDLLRVDELMVEPGQTLTQRFAREPKARYVVVLGIFRRPSGQSWRALQPLPDVPPERCGKQAAREGSQEPPVRFAVEDYRVEVLRQEARR
jgi:type VI secretion system protein VasD